MGYKDLGYDYESSIDDEEEEESKEQYWEDEYEDREGENTAATAEDKYFEVKTFKCKKCGRVTRQRATFLFKPMCCGMPMTEVGEAEKKIGLKQLAKTAAKAKTLKKPAAGKPSAAKKNRRPAKAKHSKPKKTSKTKAKTKKRRR